MLTPSKKSTSKNKVFQLQSKQKRKDSPTFEIKFNSTTEVALQASRLI
jgi:hypothetical protein